VEQKMPSLIANKKIIDLSITIEMGIHSDPPGMEPQIEYTKHRQGVEAMTTYFKGLKTEDMPDGEGWATERVRLSTHNGTHMDAPWHFHSTTYKGKEPAPAIDATPLEQCFCPGVKLDFRHFADGYVATANDVEKELQRIDYRLQPLDIVLVNTGAAAKFGQPEFIHSGCGMGREATLFLTERGVRVVGTDAWSWDAPFSHTARKWERDRDPSIIWEGHKAGREIPYWQMEKLCNLETLPPFGFDVICFPVKIKDASAGWSRVVAIMDKA
jgi:kynurenine formamidase